MPVAPARRQPDLLGATRKEIEKERSEMLAEIARMDSEMEAAREGFRQGAEALEAERRAHEQTRSEAREARVLADEREKRLAAQETELQDLRRQIEALRIEAATLAERADHADELRGLVKSLQAGQGRGGRRRGQVKGNEEAPDQVVKGFNGLRVPESGIETTVYVRAAARREPVLSPRG